MKNALKKIQLNALKICFNTKKCPKKLKLKFNKNMILYLKNDKNHIIMKNLSDKKYLNIIKAFLVFSIIFCSSSFYLIDKNIVNNYFYIFKINVNLQFYQILFISI